jgi:two-component system, OmpR family, KDP operon response regulator KdpE
MNPARILVAGSAAHERKDLRAALESERHEAVEVQTADQALQEASSGRYDLLIVHSGLEGFGLYDLCQSIRSKSNLGIIVLGGNSGESDSIGALNAGADDYIPAPLVLAELLARVRAILRRTMQSGEQGVPIILQDREIDLNSHRVKGPGDQEIHLTPKECLVLKHLVANANKLLTHQSLAQTVWQRDARGEIEYVRIVIRQLRRKLEPDPNHPRYIRTERAAGYWFDMPPESLRPAEGKLGRPLGHQSRRRAP